MKIVNIIGVISIAFLPAGVMAASLMNADVNIIKTVEGGTPSETLTNEDAATTKEKTDLEKQISEAEQNKAAAIQEVQKAQTELDTKIRQEEIRKARGDDGLKEKIALPNLGKLRSDLQNAKSRQKLVADTLNNLESEYNRVSKKWEDIKKQIKYETDNCITRKGGNLICRIIKEDPAIEKFPDMGLSPTLADGGEIKLGVLRGFIDFGESMQAPFVIAIADVTSQTAPEEANKQKLLDPDQGINIGQEYAWRYRLGNLCEGKTTAVCRVGFNWGARYMQLQGVGEEESQSTTGLFSTIQTNWSFNAFEVKNPETKLGTIRLYAAYSYFYHDGKNSDDYFSGIVDGEGNPITFDNTFGSFKYGLSIYISKSVNLTYSKFNAIGAEGVGDNESYSLNFDVLKF